jgi:hypothetical protein
MNFLCGNCGSTRLEEIMDNVTLSTTINDVGEGGDVDYGDESAGDSGSVDRYQCLDCGGHVKDEDGNDITDSAALYDRLVELEEARTFKISFTAQGHVEQTIHITNHNYTAREVLAMLKSGTAVTSAQEDGEVMIVATMTKIATIISSDNHLAYEDFERTDD